MKCCKCDLNKDEAGFVFTDFGSDTDKNDFICISCADSIKILR